MKRYALLVGVSKYVDPEITDLSFAARDAEEVGRCLVEICGFDDVRTLASGGSQEPDHLNVVDELHRLAPLLLGEDLFLFYFAGHGIETKTGAHLLMSNSRIRMPELASVSTTVLGDCLSRIECADRVLVFDACRNDPRKGMGDQDNLLTSGFSRDIVTVAETPVEGVIPTTCVLFSCRPGERAYEWPDMKHGAFSHYLLKGLQGAAADRSGRITIQALGRYVEAQVPRWPKKTGTPRSQTPWGEQRGSWREIFLKSARDSLLDLPSVWSPKPATILAEIKLHVETEPPGAQLSVDGASDEYMRIEMEADQGSARAQFNLGVCYMLGRGVERNEREAAKWFRKAAELGDVHAQFNLGLCCDEGQGVERDEREAAKWYRKAAEQGDADAQFNLGLCYAEGQGVERDEREAAKWFRKAAEQGDADAQFNLGLCYAEGRGEKRDQWEAANWYRKAADQGHAGAQCNLGACYMRGRGVGRDEREAATCYRKAADQGNATAQCNLGVCYAEGHGVERNEREAAKWFRKAAEQGDGDAIKALKRRMIRV
jgi:TPR repeat protein